MLRLANIGAGYFALKSRLAKIAFSFFQFNGTFKTFESIQNMNSCIYKYKICKYLFCTFFIICFIIVLFCTFFIICILLWYFFVPFLLSVFYYCTFLYLFYYLYFIIVLFCTFFIICILLLYFFVPFLLSVFYYCTFLYLFYYLFYYCTSIFYTYIYCYVAIGEHWCRLFCSKVKISENCIFIFSIFWDFNFFQLSHKHRFWLISLDLTEGFVSNFGQTSV